MTNTANTPTIASQQPQGLWEYFAAFWGSFEMEILVGLFVAGVFGQGASYIVKWARREIEGHLLKYLFVDNPRATLLTLIGYMSLMIGAVAMDGFTGDNGGFVGWRTVLWFGLVNGFALDSAINKGETKVWTPKERAAKREEIKEKETPT